MQKFLPTNVLRMTFEIFPVGYGDFPVFIVLGLDGDSNKPFMRSLIKRHLWNYMRLNGN